MERRGRVKCNPSCWGRGKTREDGLKMAMGVCLTRHWGTRSTERKRARERGRWKEKKNRTSSTETFFLVLEGTYCRRYVPPLRLLTLAWHCLTRCPDSAGQRDAHRKEWTLIVREYIWGFTPLLLHEVRKPGGRTSINFLVLCHSGCQPGSWFKLVHQCCTIE